jgi:hypothetical protein
MGRWRLILEMKQKQKIPSSCPEKFIKPVLPLNHIVSFHWDSLKDHPSFFGISIENRCDVLFS